MLILTRATLRNPAILQVRQLPRRFFGRVAVWPRGQVGPLGLLRLLAEFQGLRYALALSPIVVVALVWNGTALPMSGAPVLMLALIWWVEMRLLRPAPAARARLADAAETARCLDLLAVQARQALTRIAAGRGQRAGTLHLVIEQSDLAALSPLTFVSVQSEDGPALLDLDPAERRILAETLFQPPLTEARLHRTNLAQDVFLRDIALDARAVSAHARLAAALA